VTWEQILDAAPEALLVVPCGFKVAQTMREMPALLERLAATPAVVHGRVYVADGNAFFNRPGPRLVESAAIALAAIHPELATRAFPPDELS
jgi:iron complex transport system substrate-binding protein